MLQQDSSSGNAEYNQANSSQAGPQNRATGFDIQTELNRLEELILDNPRVPFTRKTIVDEERLLDQLDLVRINLPEAFEEANEILRQKEEIFLQAEEYAQDIIESAQQHANQLLDEMGLMRQAEIEAAQLRASVQQECEELQQKTLAEIEQTRMQAMQELEQMRQLAIAECEEIQDGADDYADAVLTRIEQQLSDMLRVIRNGRQQLRGGGEMEDDSDDLPEVS
ncbi:hypothetical protein PN462_22125 [Spirulina sp. CS-785/01]|uniref:hypothetical protein n=1 Tax=Spirulina sp. CS-785/01 TaxID=3021716 RepID=UPI00232C604B|nr:hypothetical protein [Spirulina sp. CS-785/01]MDB9315825.1 hypothetical protein [Spirulina sp. CS-785/01]